MSYLVYFGQDYACMCLCQKLNTFDILVSHFYAIGIYQYKYGPQIQYWSGYTYYRWKALHPEDVMNKLHLNSKHTLRSISLSVSFFWQRHELAIVCSNMHICDTGILSHLNDTCHLLSRTDSGRKMAPACGALRGPQGALGSHCSNDLAR